MNKRIYSIRSAYLWEYEELIKKYPNLLNYSLEKYPIKQWDGLHDGVIIKIEDSKIVDLCNEFDCKSIVIDFSINLYGNDNYPEIIIYDSWIE